MEQSMMMNERYQQMEQSIVMNEKTAGGGRRYQQMEQSMMMNERYQQIAPSVGISHSSSSIAPSVGFNGSSLSVSASGLFVSPSRALKINARCYGSKSFSSKNKRPSPSIACGLNFPPQSRAIADAPESKLFSSQSRGFYSSSLSVSASGLFLSPSRALKINARYYGSKSSSSKNKRGKKKKGSSSKSKKKNKQSQKSRQLNAKFGEIPLICYGCKNLNLNKKKWCFRSPKAFQKHNDEAHPLPTWKYVCKCGSRYKRADALHYHHDKDGCKFGSK